jgi:hypothetical protein
MKAGMLAVQPFTAVSASIKGEHTDPDQRSGDVLR